MGHVYVVTGANRGLGLELARQLSARGDTVVGTVRRPEDADELRETGAEVQVLDVGDDGSVAAFASRLGARPVDVLINNAGLQNRAGALADLDFESLALTLDVNALGPLRVTRALLRNLLAGTRRHVVFVTSRMGCFGSYDAPNMYGYRASKTALNMLFRCVADELLGDGFTCLALHPGWVRTDMGGPDATLGPAESVAAMLDVIDGLEPRHNGTLLDYQGRPLPW